MPRPTRRVTETPESRALDKVVREFNAAEKRLEALRDELRAAVIAAVNADKPLSKAEAARRAGYSREYVSRLVAEANARTDETNAA